MCKPDYNLAQRGDDSLCVRNNNCEFQMNEEELRQLQDNFYKTAREGFMKNELVGFKNLKEIAFCRRQYHHSHT